MQQQQDFILNCAMLMCLAVMAAIVTVVDVMYILPLTIEPLFLRVMYENCVKIRLRLGTFSCQTHLVIKKLFKII